MVERVPEVIRTAACAAGWRMPLVRAVAPMAPIILLYHGTPRTSLAGPHQLDATAFERQIAFLRQHFDLVSPQQMAPRPGRLHRPRVLLTFDDGFRNNAEVAAPILRRYEAPALFFVSSRHAEPGRFLWFAYLYGLRHAFHEDGFELRGKYMDMSPTKRGHTIARLRQTLLALQPHPAAMYQAIEEELPPLEDFMSQSEIADTCAGMDVAQIAELARDPLFEVGGHTVDHPYLTLCDPDESFRQLGANKTWLERVSGRPCVAVAYPLGDYDDRVVGQARAHGFRRGYAVAPRRCGQPDFEVGRIGVYRPSLDELGVKVVWGGILRSLGLPLG